MELDGLKTPSHHRAANALRVGGPKMPVLNSYDAEAARTYDDWFHGGAPAHSVVDQVVRLTGKGPVLELGIGTGSLALPLLEQGVEVHGIDLSEQMVARLRAKPGGERIPVTLGDFGELPVPGTFSGVFSARGSFFHLLSQDAQLSCFREVAQRLRPGGVFLLDGLLPDERCLLADQGQVVHESDGERVLRFRSYDRAQQRLVSHYVGTSERGVRLLTYTFRYAWPAELDLMARAAGLRLRERSGNWEGAPFQAKSTYHVSIYERPA